MLQCLIWPNVKVSEVFSFFFPLLLFLFVTVLDGSCMAQTVLNYCVAKALRSSGDDRHVPSAQHRDGSNDLSVCVCVCASRVCVCVCLM